MAIIMPSQQSDPLDKLAQALTVARQGFGIYTDLKSLEEKKLEREALNKRQVKEDELRGLQTKKLQQELGEDDPNSPEAIANREYLKTKGLTLPGATPVKVTRPLLAEVNKKRDPYAEDLARSRVEEAQRKREEAEFKKSPRGRLEAQGAEGKSKIGTYGSILESVTEYENAFRKGDRKSRIDSGTTLIGSFVSDNDIDRLTNKLKDDIGRLRSGGAIGLEEEKSFLNMLPRSGDNTKDAAQKLLSLRQEMGTRISSFGFTPEELAAAGVSNPKRLGIEGEFASLPDRGLTVQAVPEVPDDIRAAAAEKLKQRRAQANK